MTTKMVLADLQIIQWDSAYLFQGHDFFGDFLIFYKDHPTSHHH